MPSGVWRIGRSGKEAGRELRDYDRSYSTAGPGTFRHAWIGGLLQGSGGDHGQNGEGSGVQSWCDA